jgi:hypothetical protein
MDKKEIARITQGVRRARGKVKDGARWLLGFAYDVDLSKLDEKKNTSLGFEIAALALREADSDIQRFFHFGLHPEVSAYLWFGYAGLKPGSLISTFQSEVKKRFEQAKRGHWWDFTPTVPRTLAVRIFDVRSPEGQFLSDDSGRYYPQDDLMMMASKIVQEARGRFGICQRPKCGKIFVMQRKKRGKYCGARCAGYVNVMKKRGKI